MSSPKIVLVTGANQRLGYYIVQVTALREPTYTVVLCSRDLERGKEALQKLRNAGVTAQVEVLQLDVTNDEQIAAAVKYVEDAYGRLDGQLNSNDLLNRPANNISIQCSSTMRASFVTHPVMETSWAFVRPTTRFSTPT